MINNLSQWMVMTGLEWGGDTENVHAKHMGHATQFGPMADPSQTRANGEEIFIFFAIRSNIFFAIRKFAIRSL